MDFLKKYFKYSNDLVVEGLTDELEVQYILNYYEENDDNVLILTSTLFEANKLFQLLKTETSDAFLFPMDDFLTSVALAVSPDLQMKRRETLESIKARKKSIVVTHLMGYLKYLSDVTMEDKQHFIIELNSSVERNELESILEEYGYVKTNVVTNTGEYAIRGYIVDIFLFNHDSPVRIELFGSDVESIRYFDENTQRSTNKLDKIEILPLKENITDNKSSIYDYLNKPQVFFMDYSLIKASYKKLQEDILEYNESKNVESSTKYMFDFSDIYVEKYIFINKIETVIQKNALIFKSN